MSKNKKVHFKHLGLIDYKKAWDHQEQLFSKIIDIKLKNRKLDHQDHIPTPNYLLFCEHPHVYTLGKSGSKDNLLVNEKGLKEKDAAFYAINRGGDITYHGPGQIVGYPIFDLDNFFTDIHKYLRHLEEAVIRTLTDYNINARRIEGLTGVWVDNKQDNSSQKICAIGVRTSRWVTMHGFAFNINTDLSYFNNIIPCGISGRSVTSLALELNRVIDIKEVEIKLMDHFRELFGLTIVNTN
ncbi:MAG: lipoyl(octanoyl) transferase LipB [Cytophagales bacterium]|nr:lipoyl(octanoyl) transferase LipB [Cytophagales bacterium]